MNGLPLVIVIPIAPVTKKNSQRIINAGRGGSWRPRIMPSKKYVEYEAAALWYLPHIPLGAISGPVNVECRYYMQTRRRVDLVNLQEATLDLLVKGGVLEDDHSGVVASMDGSRVFYDKNNPRTEILITEVVTNMIDK